MMNNNRPQDNNEDGESLKDRTDHQIRKYTFNSSHFMLG